MADSPLFNKLKERAKSLGSRAAHELLASENRTDAMGSAVRRVQEGRRFFDENAGRMLGALGLATQADLDRVSKKVGKLRKRLTALLAELDAG